jgi:hypothetical protein
MPRLILPYHARHDTLAHLKGQPLFVGKSMRDVELSDVVSALKSYLPGCGLVHPESEAVAFYMGNAAWAELLKRFELDEPLPAEALALAKSYVKSASLAAQRLMYYLALIITRESRHVYHSPSFGAKLVAKFGNEFADFNKYMHTASGSMHAKDLFLAKPPKMKLGAYVDAISYVFHSGGFGGQFGGKPWAEIADVFKGLVDGKLSPEMATDVSWALCHNNGPIFNKGMSYKGYDKFKITLILDVQRSGQIPELIKDDGLIAGYVSHTAVNLSDAARALFPSAFGSYVDWQKVEAAGSMQSYGALKMAQAQKKASTEGKKVFYVTPDVWVEVTERKAAA